MSMLPEAERFSVPTNTFEALGRFANVSLGENDVVEFPVENSSFHSREEKLSFLKALGVNPVAFGELRGEESLPDGVVNFSEKDLGWAGEPVPVMNVCGTVVYKSRQIPNTYVELMYLGQELRNWYRWHEPFAKDPLGFSIIRVVKMGGSASVKYLNNNINRYSNELK